MISSYWTNFVVAGDPNGKAPPLWNAVKDKPEVMEVGDKTGSIPTAGNPAKFAFFERFLIRPEK
jgi:hypothetical protein